MMRTYAATEAHLGRFEAAASNIEGRPGKRTRLEQLELDAVHAVAEDLREELGRLNAKRVTMERHPAQANVVEAAGGPGRAVVLIHGCLCPARVGVLNFRAVRRQRRIRLVP